MQKVTRPKSRERNGARLRQVTQLDEIERPGRPLQHHDADQQPDVAGLRRPERLERGARRFRLPIPEANQEIRADADQLPAHEELQEIRREHHAHHREREQRLEGVVAAERGPRLIAQIAESNTPGRAAPPASPAAASRWTARRRGRRRWRTGRARPAATATRRGSVRPRMPRRATPRSAETKRRRACTRSRTTPPGVPTAAAAGARR